ncbi:aspartyl-tRNA synthetase-like protein [Dothistroma septosporum NZE10]|uniref:Probable aspartate--tRNA ligase, cytoplasmic n=2 Tax=Dothistroma septosporum (strain NZE10 / CBS 128990) TaxID=675120 RepID=M2WJ18_DOTSN|nr:aspartyl-tRNA synthetase-like protein [Dothistroma septosporum NZE10]
MADEARLPERPKEVGEQPTEGGEKKGPSKNELKKMAKEKEKAEKAAKRAAEEEAKKKADEASDVSKDDYGQLPYVRASAGVTHDTLAELAEQHGGKEFEEDKRPNVVFRATVANARNQSAKLSFLNFKQHPNRISDTIQAVVAASDTLSRQMVKFAGNLPTESKVIVHGVLNTPKEPIKSATIQNMEVHIRKIYTLGKVENQLPLQVADAERAIPAENEENATSEDGRPLVSLNTRLTNRTIDLKSNLNHAIFGIKEGVQDLFREFLKARKFRVINTPKLLGAATEGGANVFESTYFDKKAYLAQSPQLYKQMMIAADFERVMEIGSVFRAENSNTARHLTEFIGLDLEMAFEENYHEVVSLLEELMLYIFNGLKTQYKKETDLVRSVYAVEEFKLPEAGKVPRLDFAEGIKMLRDAGVEVNDFDDLSTPDEKKLGALVLEKYGSDFYVLDKFPLAVRPFYTMPSKETMEKYDEKDPNAGYSNSYDFFMRGQEIMSGAQRIHDATYLEKRMREHVTPVDPQAPGLKDYVDCFRYGCPPHAGGGIGLERIVMLWLGLPNVRLASLFPRDPGRLMP